MGNKDLVITEPAGGTVAGGGLHVLGERRQVERRRSRGGSEGSTEIPSGPATVGAALALIDPASQDRVTQLLRIIAPRTNALCQAAGWRPS